MTKRKLIPVACTLEQQIATDQLAEWTELRAQASEVSLVSGVATLRLPYELRDAIDDLVAREQSCCAFLDITTTVDGESIAVRIASDDPDAAPIVAMFAGKI